MVELCKDSRREPDKELAILLTSHPRQQMFMEAGLKSWEGSGKHILLGYDDEDWSALPPKIMMMVDEVFATGTRSSHVRGELRQFKRGGEILQLEGYKYFFKSAADTTTYRFQELERLKELIGDNDFIRDGTAIVFGKVDSLVKIMEPFHKDKKVGSAESYWGRVGRNLGLKSIGQTRLEWNNGLGRVHIQGEFAKYHFGGNVKKTWELGEIWTKS